MNEQLAFPLGNVPTLLLLEEVTPESCKRLLKELHSIESRREKRATLLIDSIGGDAASAEILYHAFQKSEARLHGIVLQKAHSAASLVLQGCAKRSMLASAKMKLHFFSKNISAQIAYDKEMQERCVASFKERQGQLMALYQERTGIPRETLLKILVEGGMGHELSPKEALRHKLIDYIRPHI